MKSSEILRMAAKRIESYRSAFGCYAIDECCPMTATGDNDYESALKRFSVVKPHRIRRPLWWDKEDRDSRIIGLCLAAAIAESEGD